MDRKEEMDLRDAFPQTPPMCRDAVLQAVSTYREEKKMKKVCKIAVAGALIAALLCSTAFALVHYYSVRDYIAKGNPSETFEAAIVPLEQSATSNGLTFTLGDAVFDGRDLVFTMTMETEEGASPMYVYPMLKGFCGDRELDIDYQGFDMAHNWGFFLPNAHPDFLMDADRGVTASLYHDTADEEVTWRYVLSLYRPMGELVDIQDCMPREEAFEEYEAYLRGLHAEGKIGCWRGTDMLDWLDAQTNYVPGSTFADRIEETGLFELADVITFEFKTAVPSNAHRTASDVFDFDGYTVRVKSITQSFMGLDYVLEVVYDEPKPNEHVIDQYYALADQDGNEMPWRGSSIDMHEDGVTVTVTGSVTHIADAPLTAITFTLDPSMTMDQNDALGDMPSFTVLLEE